ncbi:hypothetical protein C8J98_10766 [Luteibacter sp. OK325]|uniref:hypothetical protein n=1 Tax=Luteibacter sp. OK325 TaxID=2135670 RepID=UPI000D4B690D|nr:hypothetical protein [Luteibacter sp. OK325]PTR29934.1 hypothetical protein C8J98_10766 [Luteibacter sp. OK325]
MTDIDKAPGDEDKRVDEIVRAGPRGALMVAGIAVALVFLMWFLFYFFAFLPRGVIFH